MELLSIVSPILLAVVLAASAFRRVSKGAVALAAAVVLASLWGLPGLLSSLAPGALFMAAGLFVIAGFVKKSGLGSWAALTAAQWGGGRPRRILVLLGLLTYVVGALLGPWAAVTLVIPIVVLLATELDVSPLPFVVILSWTSLLGGATFLTSQPGTLWVAADRGLTQAVWTLTLAPYTLAGLLVTLAFGVTVFGRSLRVTNERRARVLEFDVRQSVPAGPLALKTVVVLAGLAAGLLAGFWLPINLPILFVAAAVILWLWDSPASEPPLGEMGGTLLYYGVAMAAAATVAVPSLEAFWSGSSFASWALLGGSAVLGALVDAGAAAGTLLRIFPHADWVWVVLGTTLGSGMTVLGSTTAAAWLLAGPGVRGQWPRFLVYGVLLALLNTVAFALLSLVLPR